MSLKFSDVLHADKLIKINGTKTETSERYIILTEELEKIIAQQLERHAGEVYVFPYSADALTHLFKQVCPNHKTYNAWFVGYHI